MSKPSLCISLLNGELKAAAVRGGTVAGTWLRTEPLIDLTALPQTLAEAVAKTQPPTRQAAIVFADARVSDHFLELPQARGATLTRLMERAANRVKAFQGDVAWSAQPAIPSKKGKTALLHLCPKPLLEQLMQGCHAAKLELVRLLPTTAVLASHLKSLPLQKDEVALIIAQSGLSTTIVVGRKDGRMCLGRILPMSWNTAPERVWMDVARSIGFAEQQAAVSVNSVWLFGEGAQSQLAGAQAAIKAPVKVSPVPYTPFYWAEQAATLPEKEDGNLVSAEVRAAPQRQRFMTVTAILVLLLTLGAGVAAVGLEFVRRGQVKSLQEVTRQLAKLQSEKTNVEQLYAELEKMRKTTDYLDATVPPAPEWLLAYLGQVLPPEMALTKLRVARTNEFWSVHLSGTAEYRTNIVEKFDALCTNLASGSFKVTILECDLGTTNSAAAPGAAARASKLPPNTFVINGEMR